VAIIIISRSFCSKGQEIAIKVGEQLGYSCFSRELLLEASAEFNIPELKLQRELHDSPSVFDHWTHGKERYLAFIRQAFLEHVQCDNVVYHGLAGHFFVKGVQHVLKVRILSDIEERIELEMCRANISRNEATELIHNDDLERRKWSLALYGIDTSDIRLYDLALYLCKIQTDEAVDIICRTATLPAFQATEDSQTALDNLVLAAQVKTVLVDKWPMVQVFSDGGNVAVHVEEGNFFGHLESVFAHEVRLKRQISPLVSKVPGVKNVRVDVKPRVAGLTGSRWTDSPP
jgi:cytidylate kinase